MEQSRKRTQNKRMPNWAKGAVVGGASLLIVGGLLLPDDAPPQGYYNLQVGQAYPMEISVTTDLSPLEESLSESELTWVEHKVKSGESLSSIFDQLNLGYSNLLNMLASDENAKYLEPNLRPDKTLFFGLDSDGQLAQLKYSGAIFNSDKYQSVDTIVITRTGRSTYTSEIISPEIEYLVNYFEGIVTDGGTFSGSATNAGLGWDQMTDAANVFAWDIDFAKDIRPGDTYRVLIEEKWSNGEYLGQGQVIAAQFTNYGRTLTGILAENGGFYDENGRAMKKAFLRAPLDFRRVSSDFNPRRLHPVTGRVRAHRGTDYVAPVGTPIWAAGNGVVYESSYNQYNGNYVFIRHNNTYITKYLHLTKRTVNTGDRVVQGDVIGTLGSTGRVTGPHLHYEFLVNGEHQNPRTVELPKAEVMEESDLQEYLQHSKAQLTLMDKMDNLLGDNGGRLINNSRPM